MLRFQLLSFCCLGFTSSLKQSGQLCKNEIIKFIATGKRYVFYSSSPEAYCEMFSYGKLPNSVDKQKKHYYVFTIIGYAFNLSII